MCGHRHCNSGDMVEILVWHMILISLPWVNSPRCTCLLDLVFVGLTEIEISILISVPTWIPWKKLNSPAWPATLTIFKIRNTDLQLRSPGHGCQKNKKKAGNYKALCVSCQRNHQIAPCKTGFTGLNKLNQKKRIIQILSCKTNSSYNRLPIRSNTGVRINIVSVEWTEAATGGVL